MSEGSGTLTRRAALQRFTAVAGGAITAATCNGLLVRAAAAADSQSAPVFFDDDRFALLKRMVDLMIPETDTPGAVGAGVHYFIDLMLAEWASEDRRKRYADGLALISRRAREAGVAGLVSGSTERQVAFLASVDSEAFAGDRADGFFPELKRMVLFAYYSSHAGATEELQYQYLVPDYQACAPIDEVGEGRTWFWLNFSHGL